jgi:hypothetical protein
MTPIAARMNRGRTYRAHVRFQALLGLVVAAVLLAVHPSPGWAFVGAAVLGVAWGMLTYMRLRSGGYRHGGHGPFARDHDGERDQVPAAPA